MTKHFDVLKNVKYNFYFNDNFQIKCYHDNSMIKSKGGMQYNPLR